MPPMTPAMWRAVGIGAVVIFLIASAFFVVRAYGNAQFRAGESASDAKWEAALTEMQKKADDAAEEATEAADEREVDWADTVKAEKEKIDEAVSQGRDPFDIIFDSQ